MIPRRIQLSRRRGFRLPPDTISVARPSRWGNPYRVGGPARTCPDGEIRMAKTAGEAVALFRSWIEFHLARQPHLLEIMRGKNLACWCPLDQPCHADVLIELANR